MPSRTIDPRYVPLTVTTPAGTAVATPQSTDPALGHVTIDQCEVYIPPGHWGLTGLQLRLAGTAIVPYGATNGFVLGDDSKSIYEMGVEVDGGFRVITYNLDEVFTHTHYLLFKVRTVISTAETSQPTTIPAPIDLTSGA